MTKLKVKDIYQQYVNEIEKISITKFSQILHTSKQNISKKIKNDSLLQSNEQEFIIEHLKSIDKVHTNLFIQLSSINQNLNKLNNPIFELINANDSSTELIFVKDDSMSPEFICNDMLFMDKSQIKINNGSSYVFNYKGEITCRLLYETEDCIMACSKNKDYPPFIIKTSDFRMLGRVVGVVHPVK